MIKPAYYNEIDLYAAQWLRNLIAAGHIAPGDVDTRSIEDVKPDDLRPYTQCHFFAGIGVWSLTLRRAGWPDDRPIWTGSCPCQPFSAAGEGAAFADERHLWPAFFHLITQCRPAIVIGEQVASKDADPWIDLVQADMEALGHAFGAVAFPSAGIGAPHIRDRTYWGAKQGGASPRQRAADAAARYFHGMADDTRGGRREEYADAGRRVVGDRSQGFAAGSVYGGSAGWLGHAERISAGRYTGASIDAQGGVVLRPVGDHIGSSGAIGGVGHTGHDHDAGEGTTTSAGQSQADRSADQLSGPSVSPGARPGPTNGLWRDADWLFCRDGKFRPVEPGTFPLAHGAASRMGRLRAYGNAINVEAARVFIDAFVN